MLITANNTIPFPLSSQSLFLQGEEGQLEVVVEYPKERPRPDLHIAIVCHPHPLHGGTMNNKVVTTTCRAFHELGFISIRFNYRGVGQSQGSYGETMGELADLNTITDWVLFHQHNIKLCLAGFSFGSHVAARAANSRNLVHLISIAPPVNHFDFSTIKEPKCNWLIIQGEQDEIVPTNEVIAWTKTKPVDLVLIENAGHFFHGKLTELRHIICRKLNKDLGLDENP